MLILETRTQKPAMRVRCMPWRNHNNWQQFAKVGEMTATLAEIVEQQDEWIADLETETVEAADHVDRGQAELLKLWQNVSGDRGLMLKLFAVLIFFIVLFFWLNRMR